MGRELLCRTTGGTGAWDSTGSFLEQRHRHLGQHQRRRSHLRRHGGHRHRGDRHHRQQTFLPHPRLHHRRKSKSRGHHPHDRHWLALITTLSGILSGCARLIKAGSGNFYFTSTTKQNFTGGIIVNGLLGIRPPTLLTHRQPGLPLPPWFGYFTPKIKRRRGANPTALRIYSNTRTYSCSTRKKALEPWVKFTVVDVSFWAGAPAIFDAMMIHGEARLLEVVIL